MSNVNLLYTSLKDFYGTDAKKLKKILPIINGESPISIRLIDWFVTNYCKKNNVMYCTSSKEEPLNVWIDYKCQLKGWSKKFFDPFCRRDRISYNYIDSNEKKVLITTIGQLNFFKWAIENKIVDYIKKHLEEIEKDMSENCKYDKKTSGNKQRRTRRELSISASKIVKKNNIEITLKFN